MKGVVFSVTASSSSGSSPIRRPARATSCSRSRPRACAAATCTTIARAAAGRRGDRRHQAAPSRVIAGHEPCGVVVAVGTGVAPRRRRAIGQRVMDHHYDGCGDCKHCRAGWTQMCLEGTIVYGAGGNGGHARYMKVPVHTLVPLPDALSFVTGAAISCGTGTA